MYFKIQLFLSLKFFSIHHGWDGTASSSKTEQCCAPQAARDAFGQAVVKFASTKCCLAQRACKGSQAEKAPRKLLDLGARAQRLQLGQLCTSQFYTSALRKKVEVKYCLMFHFSLKWLKSFSRPKSGPDLAAPQAPVPMAELHLSSPPAPQRATTAALPVCLLFPG